MNFSENMFITAVWIIFLIKLRWPNNKSLFFLLTFLKDKKHILPYSFSMWQKTKLLYVIVCDKLKHTLIILKLPFNAGNMCQHKTLPWGLGLGTQLAGCISKLFNKSNTLKNVMKLSISRNILFCVTERKIKLYL